MEIYGWCVMTSHVHLIFRSTKQKPEELIRDFKSYTSKELMAFDPFKLARKVEKNGYLMPLKRRLIPTQIIQKINFGNNIIIL